MEDQKVRCSAPATEVDHIKNNDDHSLENLRGLCHEHHAQKTQSESWASRARRMRQVKSSFRRSEEHPAFAYMKDASGRRLESCVSAFSDAFSNYLKALQLGGRE